MAGPNPRRLGRVFNEVPELYDRVRPGYPDELFADLATITRMDERSSVLEVGCGTGQATRSLAALGCSVTAVEPGAEMAALAHKRLATFGNVTVERSTFEEWDDRGRRFDVLVAASAWHWVGPSIGWQRAHDMLYPGGWMALLGNIVVRRPGEPEVYAETADLHERFSPGDPGWGHPPLEDDVRTTDKGWGLVEDPDGLFGATIVRWYPTVQWFNGEGYGRLSITPLPEHPPCRTARRVSPATRSSPYHRDPSANGSCSDAGECGLFRTQTPWRSRWGADRGRGPWCSRSFIESVSVRTALGWVRSSPGR
jgi:SAM-dependent methyltransferase